MFPKHRLCTSHYHRHWGKRWIQRGPWPHRICTLTRKMNINKTSLYLYVSRLLGLERKLRLSKEIMNEWLACGGIFHRVNMESGIIWDQDQEVTFEEKTKQNEDVTMERSRKTMFLAEETARYRTSGRTGFGLFSDCNNSRLAEGSTGGREWRCNWRGRQGMITYIQAGLAPGWSPSKSAVSLALVKLLLRCWLLSTQTLSRNAETVPLLAQSLPWMSPPPHPALPRSACRVSRDCLPLFPYSSSWQWPARQERCPFLGNDNNRCIFFKILSQTLFTSQINISHSHELSWRVGVSWSLFAGKIGRRLGMSGVNIGRRLSCLSNLTRPKLLHEI